MILTQRQVEQIYKSHGKLVLPFQARLTPSAQDWVRHQKLTVCYDQTDLPDMHRPSEAPKPLQEKYFWWSDGPDGVAKAAIGMSAREVGLEPMPILEDSSRIISAVRTLEQAVGQRTAGGGILLTSNPSIASLLVNRTTHLRGVVAGKMFHVEQSISMFGANVLIVERESWSLTPLKNLVTRFCRLPRRIDPVIESELRSLKTSCACSSNPPRVAPTTGCRCAAAGRCPCSGGVV